MPVNPYDDRKVSLRRPHGNGDLDIVGASYTRRKANVTEALHQDNFLANLLCHVAYATYFNKWSDPDIKLANLWFSTALARQSQKYKISTSVKYFHMFFFNNRYQIGGLKIGGRVV